jgi:phosphatidylglycerol:prolipoprotein diacylglycerol transferase
LAPLFLYIPWFHLEAWNVPHPATIPLGFATITLPEDISIHPFGALVALGVLVGAHVAETQGKRQGIRGTATAHAAAYVLIPAFALAHVVDAIFYHPETVLEHPLYVLELWNGLSSYGGFLGAILGGWAYVRRFRIPVRVFADPIAFSFPFAWVFGRLGCFGVHDHPGRVTTFFLGVENYEVGYPPYQVRHDLGLYEVLWCVVVMILFVALTQKKRPRGFFLGLLPMLYAPVRFGLDFLRATDVAAADARYFGLTPAHYFSVLLFAAGVVVFARALKDPDLEVPDSIALVPTALPVGEVRVEEEPDGEAGEVREERPEKGAADGEAR